MYLPAFVLIAGGLGFLLRIWLLAGGVDERGLFVAWHPAELLLWLVTAGVLAMLIWQTRRLTGGNRYRFNYPPSLGGAVSTWLLAAAIALDSGSRLLAGGELLSGLCGLLGLFAAVALVYVGFCRQKGQPMAVIFHGTVCAYSLIYLICMYRQWCADPQILSYCFRMLTVVCFLLSMYYRTAFDVKMERRRGIALSHLAGVFFALCALPGGGNWYHYLAMGLWMYFDVCSLRLVRPKQVRE
jgi:hypothetical protein